ncbi:MAG TPA: hypothetical protein VFF66_07090 [Brevundimonas sp.]|nr:hypothetical protein [Brevundimonas sp.]
MRHHATFAVLAAFGLAFAGCASGPSPVVARSGEAAVSEACNAFRFHPIEFWIDAEAVHPGESLPLEAVSALGRTATWTPPAIPSSCLVDWRITPAGIATLSVDRLSLTVSPDARPGETLILEARAPEGPVARHVRTIEDPASPAADAAPVDESDERVLTGLWRQVEIDCSGRPQPSEPVRELEFRAPGRFWVTFLPFETYRDYWGQVDFDPAAGLLTLTVEDGNSTPDNAILSGPARLEADGRRLVLEDFNLGNAHHFNAGWPCRYVFAR